MASTAKLLFSSIVLSAWNPIWVDGSHNMMNDLTDALRYGAGKDLLLRCGDGHGPIPCWVAAILAFKNRCEDARAHGFSHFALLKKRAEQVLQESYRFFLEPLVEFCAYVTAVSAR
eukprot:844668-Prymnesium_polylepis.1